MELLSDQGLRLDGRKSDELRRLRCRLGAFSWSADGSAYLEMGNSKVLAAVYGPREPRGVDNSSKEEAILNVQFSSAAFSTAERKERRRGDKRSLEMAAHLKQTFTACIQTELYPRSQIDIFVEVLQTDCGHYCASVNAATLALIHAGIPLRDYVCACSASLIKETPLVDINKLESSLGGPELILASLPKSGEIVHLEMSQRFHMDHLDKVIDEALEGTRKIRDILDAAVREHLSKYAKINDNI
ncbi:exosome complex component RRP41 [Lepeophtheirus salmonis]|uniref:exosome complex component RRP41 n=1 Tax=Lepeophtheirus salmonis TaxID=72036 RepID=UPI001AE61791|nr:exosome complex component RRP41-like [Lepeophtheirus salmonis]